MTGASAVVRDAFTALRDALLRRLFEPDQALEAALDAEETEPGVWQVRIGDGRAADDGSGRLNHAERGIDHRRSWETLSSDDRAAARVQGM